VDVFFLKHGVEIIDTLTYLALRSSGPLWNNGQQTVAAFASRVFTSFSTYPSFDMTLPRSY